MTKQRLAKLRQAEAAIAAGLNEWDACRQAGISRTTYTRWRAALAAAGGDPAALADRPRSGRATLAPVTPADAEALARAYLRSNRARGAGSMQTAARYAARQGQLNPELTAVILSGRLTAEARRAMRSTIPDAAIRRYRDPADGQNNGLYTPGYLRMSADGKRRILAGERQVADDATVNVGVAVPWPRGGCKCSDRYGYRLGRFQLLPLLDCASDFCLGFRYTIRENDAYSGVDVAATLAAVWGASGYAPRTVVMEGGAWQSQRARDAMEHQGVEMISAKGRPNQKLIEGWFNRLWGELCMYLPYGQVGRYRGEMKKETGHWLACRAGKRNPLDHFPDLTTFLAGLSAAIAALNEKPIESAIYGRSWVPIEDYAEARAHGKEIVPGLRHLAMPIRIEHTLRRGGMVRVKAETPWGWPWLYHFAATDGWRWDGARVRVIFDPAAIDRDHGARLELAAPWRDLPAGTLIDANAILAGPAPVAAMGTWHDPRAAMRTLKSGQRAAAMAAVTVFDERGARFTHVQAPLAGAPTPAITETEEELIPAARRRERPAPSWEELAEIAAG